MAFKIRKIASKADPFSSTLDNYLNKVAVRPDDTPLTTPTENGEYQEVSEFDYLKNLIYGNPYLGNLFSRIEALGVDTEDFIGKIAFSLMDIGAKLDENKEDIEALIESLKSKSPSHWNRISLKERTQILNQHGFDGIAPPILKKTNEFYPLTRQEIASMRIIAQDLFEQDKKGYVGLSERLDLGSLNKSLKELGNLVQNKILERSKEQLLTIKQEISTYSWTDEEVQRELLEEKQQEVEQQQEEELNIVRALQSGKVAGVLQEVVETHGADIPGADFSMLESVAPMFNLTSFLSKPDLDNFIETLETIINPVRGTNETDPDKYKLMHPENIPTIQPGEIYKYDNKLHFIKDIENGQVSTVYFEKRDYDRVSNNLIRQMQSQMDEGLTDQEVINEDNIPEKAVNILIQQEKTGESVFDYDEFSRNSTAFLEKSGKEFQPYEGREIDYQTERSMQRNWDSLLSSINNLSDVDQANVFLSNYDLTVDDLINTPLPAFDQNNPPPTAANAYNNWMRRKLIAFVQTSKTYSENRVALLTSNIETFPKNVSDAMIAIASGINQANQQGIGKLNLNIEDPFKQFPGLNKIVNAFKGQLEEVISKYRFNDKNYETYIDRVRVRNLNYIVKQLNISANEIDQFSILIRNQDTDEGVLAEAKLRLPKHVVSLKNNFSDFLDNYNPLIGIRSNFSLKQQDKKYKDNGIQAINPSDYTQLKSGMSSYEGALAIEMLNRLDDSSKRIVSILNTLASRVDKKPYKKIIVQLKNTLSEVKSFLKNYTGDNEDRGNVERLLNELKQNFGISTGDILPEEQEESPEDKKQRKLDLIKEIGRKKQQSRSAFNINKFIKKSQVENAVNQFENAAENLQKRSALNVLILDENTLSEIISGTEEIIALIQIGLSSNNHFESFQSASEKVNRIIVLLKEASDEYLGINESRVESDEAKQFQELQERISDYYIEIIELANSGTATPEQMKEMGEAMSEMAEDALPIIENLLSDFLNLDTSDKAANVAYRDIQAVSKDLRELFTGYGDFQLDNAQIESEEEAIRWEADTSKGKERAKKIKTEGGIDPDTMTVTFYDIKSTKSYTFRDARDYEIGSPRLEAALVSRKLLSLEPPSNTSFYRAVYQDTYQDPADLKKDVEYPYTITVSYTVPQNPTVLNRVTRELKTYYDAGEIKYPNDLKNKLKEISGDINEVGPVGEQINKFVSGLINANKVNERVSNDLFESLVISDIYKAFAENAEYWGNALAGSENLNAAIEKAISEWSGDPAKETMVGILKKMDQNEKVKEKLLQYGRTGNAFSTDIRSDTRKRGRESPYDALRRYAPEAIKKIDVAIEALPDDFVFSSEFTKLVSDIANNKKHEKKMQNIPGLAEQAYESASGSIESLIRFVFQSYETFRESGFSIEDSESDMSFEDYQDSKDSYESLRGPRGVEDEESFEGLGDYKKRDENYRGGSQKFNLKKKYSNNKVVFNLRRKRGRI